MHEENRKPQDPKTYRFTPWADPVLHLMKPFGIKFKHLAYAGEADIQFTANIFRDHGLPFWAHAMNEYCNILRLCDMNGNANAIAKKKLENSSTRWLGTRVIRSRYLNPLQQH